VKPRAKNLVKPRAKKQMVESSRTLSTKPRAKNLVKPRAKKQNYAKKRRETLCEKKTP
jgi:hypothetical protein